MILKLKDGDVKIELFEDVAPNHVKRIKELADNGKYDNVVFHRVIDGFMAQTGDVQFGNSSSDNFDLRKAGIKIGRYHIFLPKMLKPGAVNLRIILWKLYFPKDQKYSIPKSGLNFLNKENKENKEK